MLKINYYVNGGVLTITGNVIELSSVVKILQLPVEAINAINIFAVKTVVLNEDLQGAKFAGKDVSIMAPEWRLERDIRIILDGENNHTSQGNILACLNCLKPDNTGCNGADGKPGFPGMNGGNFYGFAQELLGNGKLFISVNGGDGGAGQNGQAACDGKDGEKVPIMNRGELLALSTKDREEKSTKIEVLVYAERGSSRGGKGGRGGMGGIGGQGGKKGTVILLGTEIEFSKLGDDGLPGQNGEAGAGGSGGRNAPHYEWTLHTLGPLKGQVKLAHYVCAGQIAIRGNVPVLCDARAEIGVTPESKNYIGQEGPKKSLINTCAFRDYEEFLIKRVDETQSIEGLVSQYRLLYTSDVVVVQKIAECNERYKKLFDYLKKITSNYFNSICINDWEYRNEKGDKLAPSSKCVPVTNTYREILSESTEILGKIVETLSICYKQLADDVGNIIQSDVEHDILPGDSDRGRDVLMGGPGSDIFSINTAAGAVTIIDFNVTEDKIDLGQFKVSFEQVIGSARDVGNNCEIILNSACDDGNSCLALNKAITLLNLHKADITEACFKSLSPSTLISPIMTASVMANAAMFYEFYHHSKLQQILNILAALPGNNPAMELAVAKPLEQSIEFTLINMRGNQLVHAINSKLASIYTEAGHDHYRSGNAAGVPNVNKALLMVKALSHYKNALLREQLVGRDLTSFNNNIHNADIQLTAAQLAISNHWIRWLQIKLYRQFVKFEHVKHIIYKTNLWFKGLDLLVDSGRLLQEPSLVNAKSVVLGSSCLYGMYYGVNGYSVIVSGAEVAYQIQLGEYQKAFYVTVGFSTMAILAYTGVPYLSLAYGVSVSAITAYNALTNTYSFLQDNRKDIVLRLKIAYKDLADCLAASPLQALHDFKADAQDYGIQIDNLLLEKARTAVKAWLQGQGTITISEFEALFDDGGQKPIGLASDQKVDDGGPK